MSEPSYLYPTPNRRRMLEDVAAGRVFRDAAGQDYLSGERKVSMLVRELEAAGWVELGTVVERDEVGDMTLWAPTAYGRAVLDVRVLDFGDLVPVGSPQLVAQVGHVEPRVLGHVKRVRVGPVNRYEVMVGADASLVPRRPVAWGELWHRACMAYAAALPPIANP